MNNHIGLDYTERTTCRLCDSSNLSPVLDLGETPLANELGLREQRGTCRKCGGPVGLRQTYYDGTDSLICVTCGLRYGAEHEPPLPTQPQELFPLVVNRCGNCEHHQLSIAVKPERLWGPSYPYQSGTSPVFRRHLEALADEVAALKPGGRVLEIASNDGTLVKMLGERGVVAMGVDPSGPDDDARMLWSLTWPPPSRDWYGSIGFDCIIALNVFAHVDDLHSFTAAVKEALAPDGVFIVEVGYLDSVVANGHFDTIYHEHMSYHSLNPLVRFFARHGLYAHNVKGSKSQGGSIRLYLMHERLPFGSVGNEHEPDISRLEALATARAAALLVAFGKLQKRGEKVAIYGCPAKLTTLLYATGLQSFPFDCVGDDNPRKVGRTTPGNHIPIVSVTEMLERRPDTIVVAAWNFFDDIRDKLRRLGFSGVIINPMGRVE